MFTNKDLLAARSGEPMATGLAQLADMLADRLPNRLLRHLNVADSAHSKADSVENGEAILVELGALRVQVTALVRFLRDNKRKGRQRVSTVRRQSAERARAAGHRPTDEEKTRIRKLLLR